MALFTTILGSVLLAAVANALVSVAISAVLSLAISALRPKPKSQTRSLDFEQIVQRRLRNGQPLEVLVGKRMVAGVGFFDDAYGTKNEYGTSVTVMSAKPCTSFHQFFLDGEPVTLDGDPTTGERNVTSHFTGKSDVSRVTVRIFLGDNNAALGAYMNAKFPTQFTVTDNFGDYCVIIVTARNTNDDLGTESDPENQQGKNFIPFQGYPEYKVEMSGVKVCDPRIPGFDYDDEATHVYSDNAALIDAQYDFGWYSGVGLGRSLIVGNGYETELMDIDQVESNADYCDTEGFGCSGILRSGSSGDQEEIWKCYNADRIEHAASVFSIPEGNRVTGDALDLSLYPAAFVSSYDEDGFSTEVYNEVQTVYAEPTEFYGEKDLPIYSNPAWIAADNHIPRQMPLPLLNVTNVVQAGKLEKQEIVVSRTPSICTISDLPFNFIRTAIGSLITLTGSDVSAVNGRIWIVKGRGQTARGDVSLSLREYAGAAAFDFDVPTETPDPAITVPIPRPWVDWFTPGDYVPPSVIVDVVTIDTNLSELSGVVSAGSTLTMTKNPSSATGAGVGVVTTSPLFTLTPSGGVPGYTYVTSKVSGDTLTIIGGTTTTPQFSGNVSSGDLNAIYKTVVTDSDAPSNTFELQYPVLLVNNI